MRRLLLTAALVIAALTAPVASGQLAPVDGGSSPDVVVMKGCGQHLQLIVIAHRWLTFRNDGGIPRHVRSDLVPTPSWPIEPGDEFKVSAALAETFRVYETHVGCRYLSVFTVRALPVRSTHV